MEPIEIINSQEKIFAGFNFYGDPFQSSLEWTEENEIGILWKRFMKFANINKSFFREVVNPEVAYEVHLYNADTISKGFFDIFVGVEIKAVNNLPLELLVKILPPTQYAIFTIKGKDIISDWSRDVYNGWLNKSRYETSYKFMFQYYDKRFKGLDRVDESEIDIYIPIKAKSDRI